MHHLIVLQKGPGDSESSTELLELGMAMASFEQQVEVWLHGPAADWVAADLHWERLPSDSAARLIRALPLYDVGPIWILDTQAGFLCADEITLETVSRDELSRRLLRYDVIHWEAL